MSHNIHYLRLSHYQEIKQDLREAAEEFLRTPPPTATILPFPPSRTLKQTAILDQLYDEASALIRKNPKRRMSYPRTMYYLNELKETGVEHFVALRKVANMLILVSSEIKKS